MRRRFVLTLSVAALSISAIAAPVAGAQPENPGCFGRDRAAWIRANGGSTWGQIASERGSTNGELNRAYKASCGG